MLAGAPPRLGIRLQRAPRGWLQLRASRGSDAGGGTPPLPPPPPPPPKQPQQQQAQERAAPWAMSAYYTKKLERRTDSLGNFVGSPDTIAAVPGWTPDAQLRLAAEALAPQLQADPAALLEQVRQLQDLLPGMGGALRRMKPAELVRMAAQLEEIAQRLVMLRARFPSADVGAMVAAHPPLLRYTAQEVEAAVEAVATQFPEASQEQVESMLSTNGVLLDGGASLASCLAGVGHLLSRAQIARSLATDPAFLFQFQPLEGQLRGERDADYLADMFRA